MSRKQNTLTTIAYIDGANPHKGSDSIFLKLNYKRFQKSGYSLVFKEVIYDSKGSAKGNCDADLVLHAVRDYFEHGISKVVLVSSDGDYTPLVKFWLEKGVVCEIVSPSPVEKCSVLLKRTGAPIVYLADVRHKVGQIKK